MKRILVGFIIIVSVLFVSCKKPTNDDIYYRINQKFTKLKSYSCTAKITIKGNKSPKEYTATQFYISPDKYYIEYIEPKESKGFKVIYNGKNLRIDHSKINKTFKIDNYIRTDKRDMFIGYFLKFFITNEDSSYQIKNYNSKKYLVLKAFLPTDNKYRSIQELWIDMNNYKPYKLITFDNKNNKNVEVLYEDFEFNIDIDEELFK